MKKFGLTVISCIFLAFSGVAQQSKFIPLLGSTQDFAKSSFCKKYKCVAKYTGEFKLFDHFVLTLPNDNPNFYEDLGQTILIIKEDKKKQLTYIELQLMQMFKSNENADPSATIMLADLLYYVINKKFLIKKDRFGDFSPDINNCFYRARVYPKENIDNLSTRLFMTGETTLQIDKKKVKYQVTCNVGFEGTRSEHYMPIFTIEIPSIKDAQTPRYRY